MAKGCCAGSHHSHTAQHRLRFVSLAPPLTGATRAYCTGSWYRTAEPTQSCVAQRVLVVSTLCHVVRAICPPLQNTPEVGPSGRAAASPTCRRASYGKAIKDILGACDAGAATSAGTCLSAGCRAYPTQGPCDRAHALLGETIKVAQPRRLHRCAHSKADTDDGRQDKTRKHHLLRHIQSPYRRVFPIVHLHVPRHVVLHQC